MIKSNTCGEGCCEAGAPSNVIVPSRLSRTRKASRSCGAYKQVNVRVDGPLIFNTAPPQVDAALAGLGITLLPEDELVPHLEEGRLVRVLEDWCPYFAGYHLYYPSRRQPSPAFALVVDALRMSGAGQSKGR